MNWLARPRISNKYNAVRTKGADPAGGVRTYDSKAEARFAAQLNLLQSTGVIRDWFPQVSVPMGTDERGRSVRYRADAMVVELDGRIRWFDRKGRDTQASRAKRAALRDRGIDVELI